MKTATKAAPVALPITAEEVAGWFRRASKVGPYPNEEQCARWAERLEIKRAAPRYRSNNHPLPDAFRTLLAVLNWQAGEIHDNADTYGPDAAGVIAAAHQTVRALQQRIEAALPFLSSGLRAELRRDRNDEAEILQLALPIWNVWPIDRRRAATAKVVAAMWNRIHGSHMKTAGAVEKMLKRMEKRGTIKLAGLNDAESGYIAMRPE
jgi:hypothetical protein